MPTNLSEIVWGSKYAMYEDKLAEVSLLFDEYDALLTLLYKQNRNCPVMIANSHSHIYGFIHSYLRGKIQITNIDMHHDIINDNAELDCGNWISNLIQDNVIAKSSSKEYKSIRWILQISLTRSSILSILQGLTTGALRIWTPISVT